MRKSIGNITAGLALTASVGMANAGNLGISNLQRDVQDINNGILTQGDSMNASIDDYTSIIEDHSENIAEQGKLEKQFLAMDPRDVYTTGLNYMFENGNVDTEQSTVTYTTNDGKKIIFKDDNKNQRLDAGDQIYVDGITHNAGKFGEVHSYILVSNNNGGQPEDLVNYYSMKNGSGKPDIFRETLYVGNNELSRDVTEQGRIIWNACLDSTMKEMGIKQRDLISAEYLSNTGATVMFNNSDFIVVPGGVYTGDKFDKKFGNK